MSDASLYLHALRQRLERLEGRPLRVRLATLARRLGTATGSPGVRPQPVDPARLARHLARAGIVVCRASTTDSSVALALGPSSSRRRAFRDPIERVVAASPRVVTDASLGSGFVVDARGLVATACHLLVDPQGALRSCVDAVFPDGRNATLTIFRAHPVLDFALGWLDQGPWPTVPVGQPWRVRYGQTVFAVGSPASQVDDQQGRTAIFRHSVSRGVVSHPCQPQDGIDWIQTDAAIDRGHSGGPLVDDAGRAVGIVLRRHDDVRASGLALPLDYITKDIAAARAAGPTRCLAEPMCHVCGDWRAVRATWYCENCGAHRR